MAAPTQSSRAGRRTTAKPRAPSDVTRTKAPKRWKKTTVHGVSARPPAAVVSEAASMGGTMRPSAGRRRPPLLVIATATCMV